MKLLAGAAVVLAVGAGLGSYFGLRGFSAPQVPKAQQSAILEQAKAKGVIDGYQLNGTNYEVTGGRIILHRVHFCNPESAGPCYQSRPLVYIEYRRPAERQAEAIYRIAQAELPNGNVKLFEITPGLPNSHTPDARIMLIPQAGS